MIYLCSSCYFLIIGSCWNQFFRIQTLRPFFWSFTKIRNFNLCNFMITSWESEIFIWTRLSRTPFPDTHSYEIIRDYVKVKLMNKFENFDGFNFFAWSSLDRSKGFIKLGLPIWSVLSALPSLIIVNDLIESNWSSFILIQGSYNKDLEYGFGSIFS